MAFVVIAEIFHKTATASLTRKTERVVRNPQPECDWEYLSSVLPCAL
jgi:hypothetical protein